jgi:hypothetical protein
MGKYHWQIKLPQNGEDFTSREQAWAAIEKERQALYRVIEQAKADSIYPNKNSHLTEEEQEELSTIHARLRDLAAKLEHGPLERLAEIADNEPTMESPFPKDIGNFLDHYHGDFTRFCKNHKTADVLTLGFAILQSGGYDEDRIREFLKLCEKSRYSKVYECPRCDRYGVGEPSKAQPCKRCFGWGYVIQEKKPENAEYDLSTTGKIAANEGREWTEQDEENEQKRLEEEDAA